MKLLEKTIKKNGYEYKLHTRGEKAFIYTQWGKNYSGEKKIFGYEVFQKMVTEDKTVFNQFYPAQEVFPSNESFGRWAFACSTEERAIEKFNELENKKSHEKS